MSVSALTLANGADLLQRFAQRTGQAPAAAPAATATALDAAMAVVKLSEASIVSAGEALSSGTLINLYA